MSKVIRFPEPANDREAVQEQAGLWLVRVSEGLSPAQEQEIGAWLAARRLHREVFLEMAALWDNLDSLQGLAELYPLSEYRPRSPAYYRKRWVAAASLAALLLASLFWVLPEQSHQAAEQSLAAGQQQSLHQTAVGEQRTVNLADGSSVVLNTNSVLEVVYTDNARNLFLTRGEGFFTVTPDSTRPFRVYAGWRMVEAVGTIFAVQHTTPESVEVVVKEGRVNLHDLREVFDAGTLPSNLEALLAGFRNTQLGAGERAAVTTPDQPMEKRRIDADQLDIKLAWTHGMLLFQSNTLGDVLAEVSRYTTTRLEAEPAILSILVEGYFPAGDIERLLVALEKNFAIEAERVAADHIRLHARHGDTLPLQ